MVATGRLGHRWGSAQGCKQHLSLIATVSHTLDKRVSITSSGRFFYLNLINLVPYFNRELEALPMPRKRNREVAGVFIPGQLSYLPKRPDGEPCSLSGSEIPDGCFDHPVVILSTDQRKREAVVLIVSFQ